MTQTPAFRRRRLPHLQPSNRVLFITWRTFANLQLPPEARTLALKHCLHDHNQRIWIYAAVVMPDHVHLLINTLKEPDGHEFSLAKAMQSIKSSSAHTINKLLNRIGPVWDEEYWDHFIRSDDELRATIRYIELNPVKERIAKEPAEYQWLWINIEELR